MFRVLTASISGILLVSAGAVGMLMPSQPIPDSLVSDYAAPLSSVGLHKPDSYTRVILDHGRVRAMAYGDIDTTSANYTTVTLNADGKPTALVQKVYDDSTFARSGAIDIRGDADTFPTPMRDASAGAVLSPAGLATGILVIIGLGLAGVAVRFRRDESCAA